MQTNSPVEIVAGDNLKKILTDIDSAGKSEWMFCNWLGRPCMTEVAWEALYGRGGLCKRKSVRKDAAQGM